MRYLSTRGLAAPVDLVAALQAGLAPDGGLFVPESLPQFRNADFDDCTSVAAVGARLLAPFFAESALQAALPGICAHAYAYPTPLTQLGGGSQRVLELYHGPTAAFKDFAARFLAASLAHTQAHADAPLTILVATSGDTGAAVAAAFHRQPGFRVVVLYPDGRVSPRQAQQLGCFGDNVTTLRVAGSFDDCQAMVKQAFADTELRQRLPLSSANSISLGRWLPQMVYYAAAGLAYERECAQPLSFIVPTGNLGNAMACLLARAMGLPIGRVVLATNANRVLPEFLASGEYQPRPSLATLANAMDVGAPSNLERLRWLFPNQDALRQAVSAESVDDAAISARIAAGPADYGRTWCPHAATAVEVLERLQRRGDAENCCVVATAHPAKFETIVEPLIGGRVPVPPSLAELLARPAHAQPLAADYGALRAQLLALV